MRAYPLEHDEQRSLMTWAAVIAREIPELDLLFAIPNGGHRNMLVAKKMKAEGVKPGVPDLFLPVARQGFHGLFIEMKTVGNKPKTPKGMGGVSELQMRWLMTLKFHGYRAVVCYGRDEAKKTLLDYLS